MFLGCHGFWQAVEVYLIGRERFQAGVRPDGVVELQVAGDGSSGLLDRGVGVKVDLIVLDGLPDTFDEDVVAPAALAIHADLDPFIFKPPGEGLASKLAALIGVEDLRFLFLESVSSRASMQKEVSIVMDSFPASTRRLNQSTTAAR